MSFKKLTEEQKNRANNLRRQKRDAIKIAIKLKIALNCFAYVAHADFVIKNKEVAFITKFLDSSPHFKGNRIKISSSDLKPASSANLRKILLPGQSSLSSSRIFQRELIGRLFDLSICDGPITTEEESAIEFIASCFRFPVNLLLRIRNRAISNQKAKQFLSQDNTDKTLLKYYQILGCRPEDSIATVKKSYRSLVSQHHPDKLGFKELSKRELNHHIKKFHKIQNAYDMIQKKILV